jgi:hypothetical protein
MDADNQFTMVLYAQLQTSIRNGLTPKKDEFDKLVPWEPHDFYPDFPAPRTPAREPMTLEDKMLMMKIALQQAWWHEQNRGAN